MTENTTTGEVPFDNNQHILDIHISEVRNRFERQNLTPAALEKMELLTEDFEDLAETLCRQTPASRSQSLALTALQEAKFWANDAIAHDPESRA